MSPPYPLWFSRDGGEPLPPYESRRAKESGPLLFLAPEEVFYPSDLWTSSTDETSVSRTARVSGPAPLAADPV